MSISRKQVCVDLDQAEFSKVETIFIKLYDVPQNFVKLNFFNLRIILNDP